METKEIDVMLVEKAKKGDKEAIAVLCEKSMRLVYFVAFNILKNEADAEDIMSDTMITVVEKVKDLKEPKAYISWLNRITVNKCKNFLAKTKPVYLEDEKLENIDSTELESYNKEFLPEEYVMSEEKRKVLMDIINEKLTYAERMTIIMFYYNGDSIKTIAEEMNCAEITVKTRLASARKKIKNAIEERFGKGVTLLTVMSLFVLGKVFKAEAAEAAVSNKAAEAAAAGIDKAVGADANPNMNSHVKHIGKEVGKKVVKNSLRTKIAVGIAGVVAVGAISVGAVVLLGDSGKENADAKNGGKEISKDITENDFSGEMNGALSGGANGASLDEVSGTTSGEVTESVSRTYKLIYKNDDNVFYYSNDGEAVYEFSGYKSLDNYFYNNVVCGTGTDYKDFIMDINGEYVVEPGVYEDLKRFDENYFLAELENKRGILDYEGNVVIPLKYKYIDYYEDDGIIYYIAETSEPEKYFLLNDKGDVLLESEESLSDTGIRTFKALTSDSVDTLFRQGTLYSLETGEVLLEGLGDGSYFYNLYTCDGKLTIYDADFKIKTEIEDFNRSGFELNEDGYPLLSRSPYTYLNKNYELVVVEKDAVIEHVLANGEIYSSKIDKEAENIFIYDGTGKELYTIPFGEMTDIEEVCSQGNYLAIKHGFHDYYRLFDAATGEVILDEIGGFTENTKNELVHAFTGRGEWAEHVVIGKGFIVQVGPDCRYVMNEKGFWAYDSANKCAYQYDLSGNVLNQYNNIEALYDLVDDCFILISDEEKSKIVSNVSGEIIFELDYTTEDRRGSTYFPYNHNADDIGIIELEDGFYTLDGRKLLEK